MNLFAVMLVAGIVDSVDESFVTVELNSKPGCEPVVTVIPREDFPCDVSEGDDFHLLKSSVEGSEPFVVCGSFNQSAGAENEAS